MSILFTALISIISVAFVAIAGILVLWVGYLTLLTICAWVAPRQTELPATGPQNRFVVMIPAHNEEKLLPDLLDSLSKLDYPKNLYTIHVVADNCTDQTALLAQHGGAIPHERFDTENIGKGCALQWLFSEIMQEDDDFDAAIVLDADSIVSANFLRVMDAKLQEGANAIQAYYAVRDADTSWATGLRAAALAVLHYLRPQGRMVLGMSAGLKGNGMVFRRSILERHAWSASVTEDIHYHMSLILDGERVIFAPDAIVWAEIPTGLSESNEQNTRWEQGRLEMAKEYVLTLLKLTITPYKEQKRLSRRVLIDSLMEHLLPPFSIMIVASILEILLAYGLLLTINNTIAIFVAILLFLLQVFYLTSGMMLTKTPFKIYLALFYLPIFLCWKIGLYVQVFITPNKQGWVRTVRVGEQK